MADTSAAHRSLTELDKLVQQKKLEVKPFATVNRPAPLMFQPTNFVTVSGENLSIYENLLKGFVGLPLGDGTGQPEGTISGCTGGCPPWDDCDA